MSSIVIRCNGEIIHEPRKQEMSPGQVALEEGRKSFIKKVTNFILPSSIALRLAIANPSVSLAETTEHVEDLRGGFQELLDVFTALAEPILWFYALIACILMVTKDKNAGWNKLKHVVYAYVGIALLPTFFSLLRWVSDMVKTAITFA